VNNCADYVISEQSKPLFHIFQVRKGNNFTQNMNFVKNSASIFVYKATGNPDFELKPPARFIKADAVKIVLQYVCGPNIFFGYLRKHNETILN